MPMQFCIAGLIVVRTNRSYHCLNQNAIAAKKSQCMSDRSLTKADFVCRGTCDTGGIHQRQVPGKHLLSIFSSNTDATNARSAPYGESIVHMTLWKQLALVPISSLRLLGCPRAGGV